MANAPNPKMNNPQSNTESNAQIKPEKKSLTRTVILVLVASIITLLSAIMGLAFKMTAYDSYMTKTRGGSITSGMKTALYGDLKFLDLYPEELMPVVREPLVVAGSFGLVIGLAGLWLVGRSLKIKKALQLVYQEQIALVVILSGNAILALVTMIYTMVLNGRSVHFDPSYIPTTSSYDLGVFSLEAWTCETPRYVPEFGYHGYELGVQCTGEKASRGLSVVLCLSSLAMAYLLIRDLYTTRTLVVKKDWKNEFLDDEGWEF